MAIIAGGQFERFGGSGDEAGEQAQAGVVWVDVRAGIARPVLDGGLRVVAEQVLPFRAPAPPRCRRVRFGADPGVQVGDAAPPVPELDGFVQPTISVPAKK
jgi:hypothetical protein